MIFSIIVNTHNQQKTINRCIKSCLTQNLKKKYEIIVIDTSEKKLSSDYLKSKKISYFHYKTFSKFPELNQLKKVFLGFKKSKGQWICFMDGDDYFKKNKLKYIYENYNLNNQAVIQDSSSNFIEINKKKIIPKRKFYKNNWLYKRTISFWPEIFGTSSLSANKSFLKNFFKSIKINKWNFLAIDALLILYALNKKKYYFDKNILTTKSISDNNIGNKYILLSKKYWLRRKQQIKYWEIISKRKIYNFDKLITLIINIFIK